MNLIEENLLDFERVATSLAQCRFDCLLAADVLEPLLDPGGGRSWPVDTIIVNVSGIRVHQYERDDPWWLGDR